MSMEGATIYKIKVTEIIDPSNFWAQIGSNDAMQTFLEFEEAIDSYAKNSPNVPVKLDMLQRGQTVLVKHEHKWKRAQIAGIDEMDEGLDVQLIDYKSTSRIGLTEVQADILAMAAEYVPFVSHCRLAGVKPIVSSKWISRAIQQFVDLVQDQDLDCECHITEGEGGGDPIQVLDIFVLQEDTVHSVSELLLESEVAIKYEDPAFKCKPADLTIPMFNVEHILTGGAAVDSPQSVLSSDYDSDKYTDFEELEAIKMMTGGIDEDLTGAIAMSRRDDMRLTQGLDRQASYDSTMNIHNEIMQQNTSGDSSAVSDAQDLAPSPGRVRGRGRSKMRPHIAQVGASALCNDSISSGGNNKPGSKLSNEATMPLDRYGLPERESTKSKQTKAVFGRDGSGDGQKYTAVETIQSEDGRQSSSEREGTVERESRGREKRRGKEREPRYAVYSASERHSTSAGTNEQAPSTTKPRSRGRGKQFEDSERSCPSVGSSARTETLSSPGRSLQGHNLSVETLTEDSVQDAYEEDFNSKQDSLQREYKSLTERLRENIDAVLDEGYGDETQDRLEKLIFPKKSTLQGLPGPGEFVIFLNVLLSKCVETYKDFLKDTLFYINQYQDEEAFHRTFKDVLMGKADEYVIPCTSSRNARHFASTVGEIWLYLGQWEHRSGELMNKCVRQLMDKWARVQARQVSSDEAAKVYACCLHELLKVAGRQLYRTFGTDFTSVMRVLKDRLLDSSTPRAVKEYYLCIYTLYESWKEREEAAAPAVRQTRSRAVQVAACVMHAEVQTTATRRPSNAHTQTENTHKQEIASDPYAYVKKMLSDLHLQELWLIFQENAVRDSTIYQKDFADVKDLLKEIGLKAGQILEIKSYLSTVAKAEPSSGVILTGNFDSIIVSPRQHEEASKRLNNQPSHAQNSIDVPPMYADVPAATSPWTTGNDPGVRSQQEKVQAKQDQNKYVPPFLRAEFAGNTQVDIDSISAQLADCSLSLPPVTSTGLHESKPFVPPPPGFSYPPALPDEALDLPKSSKSQNHKESRADSNLNWRQKLTKTENVRRPSPPDMSTIGKMVSLGKVSKKDKSGSPPINVEERKPNYRQILSATESFLERSLGKDSLKLSSDAENSVDIMQMAKRPVASSLVSEQDYPTLSDSLVVKQKKHRQSPAPAPAPAPAPVFVAPEITQERASSPADITPPVQKYVAQFGDIQRCTLCGTTEHRTYDCPEKAERFFV